MPAVWSVVASVKAELCKVSKDTFQQMWWDCMNRKKEVVLSMLYEFSFFAALSMQTRYLIMYEKGRLSQYVKGERVMNIHQRSPWNLETALLYKFSEYIDGSRKDKAEQDTGMYGGLKNKTASVVAQG